MQWTTYQMLAYLVEQEIQYINEKGQCKLSCYVLKEVEEHLLGMLEVVREMRQIDEEDKNE